MLRSFGAGRRSRSPHPVGSSPTTSLAPGHCSSKQTGVCAPWSRRKTGTLRLGASGTPGTYLVPRLVRQFVSQRPFVDVDFRLGTSAETLTALRNHEVEIAVVGGLASHEELVVEPLFDDQIVLVGAPDLAHSRLWHTRPRPPALGSS